MKVLVTGAGGFVGRALVNRLAPHHHVVALDRDCAAWSGLAGIGCINGDLSEDSTLRKVRGIGPIDTLVHLATVPGGAAERDPEIARRINLDGSLRLIDAVCEGSVRPRVIFASSIAVLGSNLPARVGDDTPLRPELLYGAHKAMVETWIGALSRRGDIEGLSLRLPGIVARPEGAEGLKSAFMSDVFHALAAGRDFVSPVSPEATFWLMSRSRIVENLVHAVEAPIPCDGAAVTLPAMTVSMGALVTAIAQRTASRGRVTYAPDKTLETAFGRYPPLDTPTAGRLGFAHDGSLGELVDRVFEDLSPRADGA